MSVLLNLSVCLINLSVDEMAPGCKLVVDEMGQIAKSVDEMGLDELGLDEMGLNLAKTPILIIEQSFLLSFHV